MDKQLVVSREAAQKPLAREARVADRVRQASLPLLFPSSTQKAVPFSDKRQRHLGSLLVELPEPLLDPDGTRSAQGSPLQLFGSPGGSTSVGRPELCRSVFFSRPVSSDEPAQLSETRHCRFQHDRTIQTALSLIHI